MTLKFRFFETALVVALVCSAAGAQVRTGQVSVRRPSVHGKPAARESASPSGYSAMQPQTSQLATVIQISPSGQVSSVFASSANYSSANHFSGVPGLGFDFPHLAAVGGTGNGSSSSFGHSGHHGQGTYIPILFGGYPYYDDPGPDQTDQQAAQPTQLQPQVIVIQQPVPTQQGGDSGNDAAGSTSPSVPDVQAAEIPDVGDFILVRRDGRVLF